MASVADAGAELYGRANELEALASLLEAAKSGRGSLVLVSGEAGIGKTALVDRAIRGARSDGCLVLTGHCFDLSMTPPYGPWIDVLRSATLYAEAQTDPISRGRFPGRTVDAVGDVRDLLLGLADRQPIVIVLEDIHWADEASLDAIRRIGRDLSNHRLLLIATYREDEINRHHPLYQFLPLYTREASAQRISLRALNTADTESWISARYDTDAATRAGLVEHLSIYSDGNPLFITELLRTLEEDRQTGRQDFGAPERSVFSPQVPSLLRQVLERRLSRVTNASRALLEVASVIGQRLPTELWCRVASVHPEAIEAATAEGLDGALLEVGQLPGELHFHHALIREALYQDVLPTRRQTIHRAVADALLEQPSPDPDEVAHHLRSAGDPRAFEWLVRAGDRAYRETYALQTAGQRYETALELAGTRHDLLEDRGWLLMRLAAVKRYSQPRVSVTLLNDVQEIARRLGDDGLAAAALWMRGSMRFLAGENGLAEAEAGHAALAALDNDTLHRMRRRAMGGRMFDDVARVAGLVWWHGYHGVPSTALDLAATIEQRFTDDRAGRLSRAHAAAGKAFALSALGRVGEARIAYETARRIFDEYRYEFFSVTATAFEFDLVDMRYFTASVPERRQKASYLYRFGTQGLQELVAVVPATVICSHLYLEGQWEELPAIVRSVESNPRSIFIWNYAAPVMAQLARNTGDPERARELLRMLLPHGHATGVGESSVPLRSLEGLALGAEMALDEGDLDEAARWIGAHRRWLDWCGYRLCQAEHRFLQARYRLVAGDAQAALEFANEGIDEASAPEQPLALIAGYRLRAQVAHVLGRTDAAVEDARRSLELAEACEAPFEIAQCLSIWADIEAEAADRVEAREKLGRVIEICEPLAAQPLLSSARNRLAEIDRVRTTAVLSEREQEVLALVADGLTDREVAERLYISPRTVNQHLRSIYNKLGVNSRAAATRRAIELELL